MILIRIAVTGVGGGVGQSIMKALSISSLPIEVYPIDVKPLSAGLFRGTGGVVLPKPEEENGKSEWERWLKENSIMGLIPGSDYDLLPLAAVREDWLTRGICTVLSSDVDLVQICRDKALTYQYLEKAGIPVPRSAWGLSLEQAVSWADINGYPVIIKPRGGFASRNVYLVDDEESLRFFYKRVPNPILQEYLNLSGSIEEFTCAVFVDKQGLSVGTFMARRNLSAGATYRAEIKSWPEIEELLVSIGKALRPRGPINVQLRLTERGPVPFEINIRCSGTSAIRAYFGYNEPEMLIRHYLLGESLKTPVLRSGYAFRYWNEIFLDGIEENQLHEMAGNYKGKIILWP